MFASLALAASLAAAPLEIPRLAGQVQQSARAIAADLASAPAPEALKPRIEAFAGEAMALSKALRAAGAPHDLPCIFKGISEDAAARAADLGAKTGAQKRFALAELQALLDDAQALAPQAAALSPAPDPHDPLQAQ